MLTAEIRKKFLDYFNQNGHTIVPSSPTVPHDDPTLLFNNAGMNQFKDVFLGKSSRDYTRATSSQKCIRVGGKHNDLDNVGHTTRHMTFFEMIGNFSFGDYFKKEAIRYAWEVSTEIFQFDPEKLWISIYKTDEEAFEIWKTIVPEKKIVRMGEADNFWSMGETGPCGPCSDLLYDRGAKFSNADSPLTDQSGERFLEFWSLVFMQDNRDKSGHVSPLPKQSIDTGVGLERAMALIQNVPTVFQTDILRSLIDKIEEVTGVKYNPNDPHLSPAFHVIADHIRALSFAIADGAEPSNVDRGYVLRKILRRAVRYSRRLGMNTPFLRQVFERLLETMGSDYLELKTAKTRIEEILTIEEESFLRTLKRGGSILNTIIESAEKTPNREITGKEAFQLKDTYGFPIEEILLIAKDSDLTVNLETYQLLEEEARERSRAAKKSHHQKVENSIYESFVEHHGTSKFVGYTDGESEGTIKGIFVDGTSVDQISAGEEGIIILDETPFYAEKGGQVGDTGTLSHKSAHFKVTSCQSPYPGVIAHIGTLEKGALIVGEPVVAEIDAKRRKNIAKHHTATHLIHYALEKVLGSHIRQAGSLVEENRARFDFNHHKGLTHEQIREIEAKVNAKIWENAEVNAFEVPFTDVQKHPEIKQFFGDKYGSTVRVVDIGGYSKELCGGTHVHELSDIGYLRIAKEGSIAKGVRRIEAVIGAQAEALRYEVEDRLGQLAERLKAKPATVDSALSSLLKENQTLKEELEKFQGQILQDLAKRLLKQVKQVGLTPFLGATVDVGKKELPTLSNALMEQMSSGVLAIAVKDAHSCQLLVRVSPDLVAKGMNANTLIREAFTAINGAGGGKKETAQAGGKNPEGLAEAFGHIEKSLKG